MTIRLRGALGTLLAGSLLPVLVFAHHSFFGRFDTQSIAELEGEVADMQWRNPHTYLTLRGVDASGAPTNWHIETSSLTVLKRMGIEADTIKIGDRVRIAGNPSATGKQEMYARHLLLPDGRELLLNVGLKPRWTNRTVGDESLLMAHRGDPSHPELGLFRVWSHTRAEPRLFREATDPNFDIQSYPMTDAARAAIARFDRVKDSPIANCTPKGMPTIMEAPYPIEFLRQADGDILLKVEEYDLKRTIHMSAAAGDPAPSPSPLGYSTGRWDGTTLEVATTHVNWPYFSQLGIPQSPAVRLVERFSPTADGSRLDYEMTVVDPATFTKPVVLSQYWLWLPSVKLLPYNCTVH